MSKVSGKLTPLMEQYWEIKNQHPDKVLLFRMGDFFEMFYEDAVTAAPILNIALTSRNKKSQDETPMCGVPHHSIAGPIGKLLVAGHKVAICDQIEDPKEAKGIVKRAVTRILSPGMVYDPETLDELSAHYLCAFDTSSVAFVDSSTGEAFYYLLDQPSTLQRLIQTLNPAEVLLTPGQKLGFSFSAHETHFQPQKVKSAYQLWPLSCQTLMSYLEYMQGESALETVNSFEKRQLKQVLEISPTVGRHLELFFTYRGESKGSLFQAINRTKTSAGARTLKNWLSFPLTEWEAIQGRQKQVSYWFQKPGELKALRKVLSQMGDIERRLLKISNPSCHPRDLLALSQSLKAGSEATSLNPFHSADPSFLKNARDLLQKVESTIVEEPPAQLKNGGFIQKGVSDHLDQCIRLSEESQSLLVEMEQAERQKTGIPSLKIRYNNVFGYYIEVTHTHKEKVPDHYKRKQTLTQAERYLTQELQELEDKILSARTKRVDLEQEIFQQLKSSVVHLTHEILQLAHSWSELDVLSSMAWLAMENNYTPPHFVKEKMELRLTSSRHPVVEQEMKTPFVPNDIHLKPGECLLLTGPNMAGKSTLMRQVAITAIMAQMGSYVPAKEAHLPIFEKLYTRIGASDFLSEGLSTFMVEMKETAEMLNQVNDKTLVILDEVGRGTSTYDGMSLAQSILEYLVTQKGPITLFATHYHELTHLSQQYGDIHNAHMSIAEKSSQEGKEIQFLYTLKQGPANKSYGIQVAQLAGLPRSVTKRAKDILKNLEASSKNQHRSSESQLSLLTLENQFVEEESGENMLENTPLYSELMESIKNTPLQQMTPLEALNKIAEWQKQLN